MKGRSSKSPQAARGPGSTTSARKAAARTATPPTAWSRPATATSTGQLRLAGPTETVARSSACRSGPVCRNADDLRQGHLPHLCHRDGIAEIPAHTPHDYVAWIVSPFEWIGCGDGHVSTLQIGTPVFRNGTVLWRRRGISAMAVPQGATEPS
jgi:hypothetical protein